MNTTAHGPGYDLTLGDSLQAMQTIDPASMDAIITDPPYASGGRTLYERQMPVIDKYVQSGRKKPSLGEWAGDQMDARAWKWWMIEILREGHRVTKPGGKLLVFIDWRQLPNLTDCIQAAGWLWKGVAAWDKTEASRPAGPGHLRHQCEYIVWAARGKIADTSGVYPGCFRHRVVPGEKLHECGKPVSLMHDLVRCAGPKSRILDPFMGSASTGVAAIAGGHHFVGIESEPRHFDTAVERMRAAAETNHVNLGIRGGGG